MKSRFLRVLKDESGQGATEYILMIVVVIGIIMFFKDDLKKIVKTKVDSIQDELGKVTSN